MERPRGEEQSNTKNCMEKNHRNGDQGWSTLIWSEINDLFLFLKVETEFFLRDLYLFYVPLKNRTNDDDDDENILYSFFIVYAQQFYA